MTAEALKLHAAAEPQRQIPTPADPPLLVDTATAARLLGISPRTLWSLTQRGEIRCKRIGRLVRYNRLALEEFANNQV
jgi:excisionase family DNA binding protein